MKEYHYLISSLGDLSPDQDKLEDIQNFIQDISDGLTPEDLEIFNYLRLQIDDLNIMNPLKFAPFGLFTREQIMEASRNHFDFPGHLQSFLEEKMDILDLPKLYKEELSKFDNSFLYDYVTFNYQLRFLVIFLNCRKHGLNIERQLIPFDDFTEGLVAGHISSDYWVNEVVSAFNEHNFIKRERLFLKIRWDFIDEYLRFEYFSLNIILAHFIKLVELNNIILLDGKNGQIVFDDKIDSIAKNVSRRVDQ
jgi:hypothetical protein